MKQQFVKAKKSVPCETRRCGSVYLVVGVLGVGELFCVLGMCKLCSNVAYFRGWLRCVRWNAWRYIERELVR